MLLIILPKLDAGTQKRAWYTAIDKTGAIIAVWPVANEEFPGWLQQRLRAAGLKTTPEALGLLSELYEGHLLAATQLISQLRYHHQDKTITEDTVREIASDNTRFDVFALTDAVLRNDVTRITRILKTLRAEKVEPILILWALTRECRHLLACLKSSPAELHQVFSHYRIWPKNQPLYRKAVTRLNFNQCQSALEDALQIELSIKGLRQENLWDALLRLSLMLGGTPLALTA